MPNFRFDLCELPPEAESLRDEVRQFLRENVRDPAVGRARSWGGHDQEFSRKVGARGWIGMTWPKKYGGHERTFLERYVVLEEMLAAGAPVSAHWVADRQSGPLLLRFGTEEQRERFLPAIARGELAFAIGMSEPDSGSDLASLRTRAEKVPGGYRVNGTKVWTSNAHKSHYMIATFRTASDPKDRHAGLTQFLVDAKSPGITMSPIIALTGEHHFNLVLFEDVFRSHYLPWQAVFQVAPGECLCPDELFEPGPHARNDQGRPPVGEDLAHAVVAAHRDDPVGRGKDIAEVADRIDQADALTGRSRPPLQLGPLTSVHQGPRHHQRACPLRRLRDERVEGGRHERVAVAAPASGDDDEPLLPQPQRRAHGRSRRRFRRAQVADERRLPGGPRRQPVLLDDVVHAAVAVDDDPVVERVEQGVRAGLPPGSVHERRVVEHVAPALGWR